MNGGDAGVLTCEVPLVRRFETQDLTKLGPIQNFT